MGKIVALGGEQWQACAWLLARRWPAQFGNRNEAIVQAEVERRTTDALDRLKAGLPAEMYARVLAILAVDDAGTDAAG